MLTPQELKIVIAAAKRHFGVIRKKYPELKGYLVFSLPSGETEIDSSFDKILSEFPEMVIEPKSKTSAHPIATQLERMTKEAHKYPDKVLLEQQKELLKKQLKHFAFDPHYNEDAQVELCFHELNYELVWKLQRDELIDRTLTPQSKASIRIVLGTLAHFKATCSEELTPKTVKPSPHIP
jgi:hypothetical protein